MKLLFRFLRTALLGIVILSMGYGCGQKKDAAHETEESPSGATFKAGKGVIVSAETSQILGLEIADVIEEQQPLTFQMNVQIFTEKHRLEEIQAGHTGCDAHGSGFLPSDKAAQVKPKQPVKFFAGNEVFDGFVVSVQKQVTQGETEVILGVTSSGSKLKDGDFVNAKIFIPRNESVTVIPESALLRTVEGTFVYAVNGDAYYKTAVTVGNASNGRIEITEGLYAGDQVVTKPVETLWLIELRATKGGGHCH